MAGGAASVVTAANFGDGSECRGFFTGDGDCDDSRSTVSAACADAGMDFRTGLPCKSEIPIEHDEKPGARLGFFTLENSK